jgi:hypothetical protein
MLASAKHNCGGEGVGTELKKLFSVMRIKQQTGCGCRQLEKALNKRGPVWCRENTASIAKKLERQAAKLELPFNRVVALVLIRLAISITERKLRSKNT